MFSQQVGGGEGLVTDVGVVGEGKGEFAVGEGGRGYGRAVEPLEERPKGEEALVEGAHYFWIGKGGFGRDLTVYCQPLAMVVLHIHTVVRAVTVLLLTLLQVH